MVHTVHLDNLGAIKLWDLQNRNLYTVHVRLLKGAQLLDSDQRRIGFRHAEFTDHGFELNGKVIKLRGLDRHQTFPFVGQAMPGRCQRSDANILRNVMHSNIVRTSHYPQSRHFLDACDEMGLLVLEEIPGWQHIGDLPWQDISVDNVSRMIRRDWNHPSIILWGVRINESKDNHDFYVRTNAMSHKLDPTRQTGGIRYFQSSEFLEDVFTMNDFGFPLKPPNHPRYLNTEFVGHTYPTKTIDQVERIQEHMLRHARIHDQLASNPQYAGGIGWCAFDYNTHADFGTGDRICYHGVTDMFREPKSGGRLLQIAVRSGGRDRAGAGVSLGARRRVDRLYKGVGMFELRATEVLHRTEDGGAGRSEPNGVQELEICAVRRGIGRRCWAIGAICGLKATSVERKSSRRRCRGAASIRSSRWFPTIQNYSPMERTRRAWCCV